MQRPKGITVTTILMSVLNMVGVFAVDWHKSKIPVLGMTVCLIATVVGFWVLRFYWLGRNWARWLVLLASVESLWCLRFVEHPTRSANALTEPVIVSEAILSLYLLYYLNTAPVRAWFSGARGTDAVTEIERV